MKIAAARVVVADWVRRHARPNPTVRGAFLTGSAAWLSVHAELPLSSDVDVIVAVAARPAPAKLGTWRRLHAATRSSPPTPGP
jgi:hypothetical protein